MLFFSDSQFWQYDVACAKKAQAFSLIKLGARAGLVVQLTGLPKSPVKALYQKVHNKPSPPGLSPFTDNWYLQNEQRQLHANIIWKIDTELKSQIEERVQRLISVYQCYLCSVNAPLLNIQRAYFVPQLLQAQLWQEETCKQCKVDYICSVTHVAMLCPACRIQQIHRCRQCNAPLSQSTLGRRTLLCDDCHA